MMLRRLLVVALIVALASGKAKKGKHQKPGRALFDRLASTPVTSHLPPAPPTASFVAPLIAPLPTPLDVAPYSRVEANATCGTNGAEDFCRQTPGRRGIVCGVCEGPGGAPARQHPSSHILDGDPATWWQSPNLASGDYHHVSLLVTLPDEMELLHVIVKTGPSSRPLAWSLEVSSSEDGDDFRLIRAFGDKDHCRKLWDLRPERRRRKVRSTRVSRTNRSNKPTCSTQFSSPRPLENGEMHVAIGEGVSAHRVRISFRAGHPSPEDQQFYTVRSLTLAARCICSGHAEECAVDKEGAKCSCLHGTCGVHCERCCDGSKWSPNEPCSGLGALECDCGDRGTCQHDEGGSAICVNCTENRAGVMCDGCIHGFYNEVPGGPCFACGCHPEGSDGVCKLNHKTGITCNCHPGATGPRCDSCIDSAAQFPRCDVMVPTTHRCKCDPRGVRDAEMVCEDVCECKDNVIGERCDTCAPGHFGLSSSLPEGCKPCYCSGVTEDCVEDPNPGEELVLQMGEGQWLMTDFDGNETMSPSLDDDGRPYVISYEVEGWKTFFLSPLSFEGEQLDRYGGDLRVSMYWSVVRGDAGGSPTRGPDVIIVDQDETKLAYGDVTHVTSGDMEIIIPIVEGNWYILTSDQQQLLASRSQMMNVLRKVKILMIRAHFHTDQDEVRLQSAYFTAPPPLSREVCSCGVEGGAAGYAGRQCARCAWTHVRAGGECVPCHCNGHADCQSEGGPCGECRHNTTGAHCERCLSGHYGNPLQGGCKPCACPLLLPGNNFSPNCALAADSGDEYVCTQCPPGYTGDHCERCEAGYWGSPATLGGECKLCACGGAPCHPASGACRACQPHREGAACELCQEGYYLPEGEEAGAGAEAGQGACVACACGAGALAAACEERGGRCACRRGWRGRACDTCAPQHGDPSSGCPPCQCGVGSLSDACDAASGACECAVGVTGLHCDECMEGYFNITSDGCQGCNCSSVGAESNACDIKTGQCRCKPHVVGRACDTCEEGYWGVSSGGCRQCACGGGACDPLTGACACPRGLAGAHCDRCAPGYYGFGPNGCLECGPCGSGRVCDARSGRCGCPDGARGPTCTTCAPGHWGRAPHCARCRCGAGATSGSCEAVSGQCRCRAGWAGRACDECAAGHFGPRCRPCACHGPGSLGCDDRTGLCPCDDEGRCVCKENVRGDKCDTCRAGTFGLQPTGAGAGCAECFCFGRSQHCAQGGLVRAGVRDQRARGVVLIRGEGLVGQIDQNSLLAIHTDAANATIAIPYPPVPVYLELDKRFLGDKLTSYAGSLRFKVLEEGGDDLPSEDLQKFPLVRIYGSDDLVLDYFEESPSINGSKSARLHESLWVGAGSHDAGSQTAGSLTTGPRRVTRPAFMLALHNLQRVLVRVSSRAPASGERMVATLVNVSLDTAIEGSGGVPALGIELCSCPPGLAGPSCNLPAPGFWLPVPARADLTSVPGTITIQVGGEPEPCRCHQRAATCHPFTGHCINCTDGTGGAHCEQCAAGYHGAPSAPGGCQPCPCPDRTRNFAAACAFSGHTLRCLCKPGYIGDECEECDRGWTRTSDGGCEPCNCDPHGSEDQICDSSGRCRCRNYATGPKCDKCRDRLSYLDKNGCQTCDNCSLTLIKSVQHLTKDLHDRGSINELSKIPKPYLALHQYTDKNTKLRNNLTNLRHFIEQSRNFKHKLQSIEDETRRIKEISKIKHKEAETKDQNSYALSLESAANLEEVLKQRKAMAEQIATLDDFARGEKHLNAHKVLKEAKHLLRNIKGIRVIDYLAGANDAFDMAILQSASIQEYNYRINDTLDRLQKLKKSFEVWESTTDDIPKLADVVWDAGDVVAALHKRTRPRLVAIRDTGLRCALVLEDINTLNPKNVTDQAEETINQALNLTKDIPTLIETLKSLTAAAEEKEGILYNLMPIYKEKYLNVVQKHVAELSDKAKKYKNLFAGTKTSASAGMTAARAWTEVTKTLKEATEAADEAMDNVLLASQLARGAKPMVEAAENAMKLSKEQEAQGDDVKKRAEELRIKLDHLRRGAERVNVALRALGWEERELASRPKAQVSETLAAANDIADRVFGTTRVLYDEASEIRRRVRYQMRRELAELQKHGDSTLGATQEHISGILGGAARGRAAAAALGAAAVARGAEHVAADSALRPRLAALRAMVARARHAADSISVSLSSPPGHVGCSHSYPLPASSPATTHLALTVSFDNLVHNGPIFHLEGEEGNMDLIVEDSRLKLTWDLGDGEGIIHHPEKLEAAHDDSDLSTYRIIVERVWNTAHLTLERAGRTEVLSSNSTPGTNTALSATALWLGTGEEERGLVGCIHGLSYDDKRIGLWNFIKRAGQCIGCTQRSYNPSRSGEQSLAWFNGEGYAELKRTGFRPFDKRQFSVSFTFRTRDQDALLFMAREEGSNRSVSVVMESCRVVFRVEYSSSSLTLAAGGRHCHGRLVHVQAIRLFANKLERGSLRVNGEERLGSPEPPVQLASALPELGGARYWVGGAPPAPTSPAALPPALLGCLGALNVDREGYDPLDTPDRHGVERGCSPRVLRSVKLEGRGYLELPSPAFRRKAALGLSFRAEPAAAGPAACLLYRAPATQTIDNELEEDEAETDDKHYLALLLNDGDLEVVIAAGKGELRLKTNSTKYNDGKTHVIRLLRIHKEVQLWVDGEQLGEGALGGHALPARGRGLFVGGARGDVTLGGEPLHPFTGTISDFIVDGVVIGFESSISQGGGGVRVGRAPPAPAPSAVPPALRATPPPAPNALCSKTPSYTVELGAVKFGDARGSHALLRLPPAQAAAPALAAAHGRASRDVTLALYFRTFAKDAILALIPGSKLKPKHYSVLMVREGRLRLLVRGRKRRELSLAANVSDGLWRPVTIRISASKLVLASGGAAATGKAPRKVALAARVYIGGLPDMLPHIPDSVTRIGGLVGCIRRVSIGGRAQDLARAMPAAVGQCFPNVEPGAHFAGDSHATWSSTWSWGGAASTAASGAASHGELRLQFRTTAPAGLLLAARGFLLETSHGAVVLTRYSSTGEATSRAEARGDAERALCDDKWHQVVVRLSPSVAALTLDGGIEVRGDGAGLTDDTTDTPVVNTPLYIGGLPDGTTDNIGAGRDNFKGCIRDVTVGGDKRDWTKMEHLHNVLLDSCPVPL